MADLFNQKGVEAYAFSPNDEVYKPKWLNDPAPVISNEEMAKTCTEHDLIIGGWPDRKTAELIRDCPAHVKIFYPQCNFFMRNKDMVGADIFNPEWGYNYFWAVSKSNKERLDKKFNINTHIVHPYFRFDLHQNLDNHNKERQILALWRKGKQYVRFVCEYLNFTKKIGIKIIDYKFTENEFIKEAASHKLFLHTAIGHHHSLKKQIKEFLQGNYSSFTYAGKKYDEGFPLPPAEAALAGCVVVGFAKNGDLEWMDKQNSFIAKDRSYISLFKQLNRAIKAPNNKLKQMNKNAIANLQDFNKENTWKEIKEFLENI